jgi:NADPH2 dehydrogenase
MAPSSRLFQPLKVGKVELSNRIVMAPLTRFRADKSHVPHPFVPEYYEQRASYPGTLLITEATFISAKAGGYDNVPGIYNQAQIDAWKKVTAAVHAKKSFIYVQLWALGRAATLKTLKAELGEEGKVVSASDIPFEGGATPTPLTEEEIHQFIGYYVQAAKNAMEAGFDGVEIHGANGYLIDQFLQDVSNKRTDGWGGSIEKRARFGLEVAKAVVEAIGAERTGIRMSPYSEFQGMKMKDPEPQFSYYTEQLKKLKLAYIHVVESRIRGNADVEATEKIDFLVDIWGKTSPVFIAGGFRQDSAYRAADEEYTDKDIAVVFGRYFISNPDLVFKVREGIKFTDYDRDLFYNKEDPHGYIDWPFSKEWEGAKL